ncbi:response regulator [Aquimarina litoralis]|uniref:response regulator n=1 Tax=Aquimarina litoralis TaxID=584605 RepID=UPI001C58B76B|nr:response regulator [Aquimarina litoralis]
MKTLTKVLLVDDSESTVFFNKIILSKSGYVDEMIIAKNGLEALDILKSGTIPELIFLDINMPVMDGWEFLEEFQKLNETSKNTKIILMIGAPLPDKDKAYAQSIPQIKEFQGKMLSRIVMDDIMRDHFDKETFLVE